MTSDVTLLMDTKCINSIMFQWCKTESKSRFICILLIQIYTVIQPHRHIKSAGVVEAYLPPDYQPKEKNTAEASYPSYHIPTHVDSGKFNF